MSAEQGADTKARGAGSVPKVLWLIRRYPFPPTQGGDVIYSRNLMQATADAGAKICAFVLDGANGNLPCPDSGNIEWVEGGRGQRPTWTTLFSLLPNHVGRFRSRKVAARLRALLVEHDWDAIVFDNISTAAYVPEVRRALGRKSKRPKVVYIAHNHETTTMWSVVRDSPHTLPVRLVLTLNALKNEQVERDLVALCDLAGVNTEEDGNLFAADAPNFEYVVLKPAYDGRRLPLRDLSAAGRTITVLGSYLWIPKKANLEAFLKEAGRILPQRGIEVRVVGAMDEPYRRRLVDAFPWATIVGPVPEVGSELDLARIGIVPELAGGGFKHKTLFYVFNRVAVAGIANAMAGSGLCPGTDYLCATDLRDLVEQVGRAVDDLPMLSAMVESAYGRCEHAFDWPSRGKTLADALSSSGRNHGTVSFI